jgi:hypothetical protein
MLFVRRFTARFHAFYGDSELVVGISPLSIIQGDSPLRVRQMVLEWAEQHQVELAEAWNRCGRAERPRPIQPLS